MTKFLGPSKTRSPTLSDSDVPTVIVKRVLPKNNNGISALMAVSGTHVFTIGVTGDDKVAAPAPESYQTSAVTIKVQSMDQNPVNNAERK